MHKVVLIITAIIVSGLNFVKAQTFKVSPGNLFKGKTLTVTIGGNKTHFKSGAGTSVVKFKQASNTLITTITASSFSATNDTVISANVSIPYSVASGYYDGVVTDAVDGTITVSKPVWVNDKFTISITKVYPDTIRKGQTLAISVYGKHTSFGAVGNNLVVWFQQGKSTVINPASINVVNDTLVIAKTTIDTAAVKGLYDVYVKNSLDTTIFYHGGIYISASGLPSIASFSPDTSSLSRILKINISGANTRFGSGEIKTKAVLSSSHNIKDTIAGYNYSIYSPGSMSCYFSIPKTVDTGYYKLNVYDTYDGQIMVATDFQIRSNTQITDVNPSTANTGATLTITIAGYETTFNSGSGPLVWLRMGADSIAAAKIISLKPDTIQAEFVIPGTASAGYYSVIVYDKADSFLHLADGFYIGIKSGSWIASVNPSTGNASKRFKCNITTTGTAYTKDGLAAIWLSKSGKLIFSDTAIVLNDSLLSGSFAIPATASGYYRINIKSGNGDTLTLFNAVYMNPVKPGIGAYTPASAFQKQKISMVITGAYTSFRSGNESMWLSNGSEVINTISYSVENDTSILCTFNIPKYATPGLWNLNVKELKDNTLTVKGGFKISKALMPDLLSVAPDTSYQGFSVPVVISGTHTYFGSDSLKIWLEKNGNKIFAGKVVVKSDSAITAQFDIPMIADTGDWDIYVSEQLDSVLIMGGRFYVNPAPPPFLLSIGPDSGRQGASLLIKINGFATSFLSGKASVVFRQGNFSFQSLKTIVQSSLYLRCNITIPSNIPPGNFDVYVTDSVDGVLVRRNAFKVLPIDQNTGRVHSIMPDSAMLYQDINAVILFRKVKIHGTVNISLSRGNDIIKPQKITVENDSMVLVNIKIPLKTGLGWYDAAVSGDSLNTMVYASGFYITKRKPASVISVVPDSAAAGLSTDIDIKARNTIFDATSGFYIEKDGIIYNGFMKTVISDSEVIAAFPIPLNASLGAYHFFAKDTADSIFSATQPFYIIHNTGIKDEKAETIILEAWPNPFNASLNLKYVLTEPGEVSIEILDITGKILFDLSSGYQPAGIYQRQINPARAKLLPGIYMLRLKGGDCEKTIRVACIK